MADDSIYRTPRSLAEDVMLIGNGGGFLSDDHPIDERQVLYWLSGFIKEMYKAEVDKARGVLDLVDRRLWKPFCLILSELPHLDGPLRPLPQMFTMACLPDNLLSTMGTVCLREVIWGNTQLAESSLGNVKQGGAGYSRFGKVRSMYAVVGPNFYASLPFDEVSNKPLSALGVLMPAVEDVVEHPDEAITYLPEWDAELRRQALILLGAEMQGLPDQKNNGANLQSDKR